MKALPLLLFMLILLTGCPYTSNVPLLAPGTGALDKRLEGYWKQTDTTLTLDGVRIRMVGDQQAWVTEYSWEQYHWVDKPDSTLFTGTRVGDAWYIEWKQDTARKWQAWRYLFALDANALVFYTLKDTAVGLDRKFPNTAAYRQFVQEHQHDEHFFEEPDMVIRQTPGERNGDYVDLLLKEDRPATLEKMVYNLSVGESVYLYAKPTGKAVQNKISAAEKTFEKTFSKIKPDTVTVDDDNHGYRIKSYQYTAHNQAELNRQMRVLGAFAQFTAFPVSLVFENCRETIEPELDKVLETRARNLFESFPDARRVEKIQTQDFLEYREELREQQAFQKFVQEAFPTIADFEKNWKEKKLDFAHLQRPYWKMALYRFWLK